MRTLDLCPLSLLLIAVFLAGCGGTAISITSPADASVTPGDGGGGTPPDDGSVPETSTVDDGGSPTEASISDDGGAGADAADAGSCNSLPTRAGCIACCDTTFAGGLSAFDIAVEECACQTDLCGPSDGGASGGTDAGDFGAGACTGTCGTTTAPKAGCEKCILDSLGTAADAGPCRSTVVAACASSIPCKRYVACTDGCPAK